MSLTTDTVAEKDVAQRRQRDALLRYGSVFFDSAQDHTSAWACVWDRTQKRGHVQRIAGTHEMASDVVWLTNLKYDLLKAAQLLGTRVHNDAYLSNRIGVILEELGVGSGEESSPIRIDPRTVLDGRYPTSAALRVAMAAWAMNAVEEEAQVFMPFDAPPVVDMASLYQEDILPPSRIFYGGEPPPDAVESALSAANNPWVQTQEEGAAPMGMRMRVALDRVAHARVLLSVRYPVSGWKLVDKVTLLNSRPLETVLQWLSERPNALLRVVMKRTDLQYNSLINYGSSINRNRRTGMWVTASEAARLWGPCEMTAHDCIIGSQTASSLEWIERAGLRIDSEQWESKAGSYAFHLFCDILWRGLLKAPRNAPRNATSPSSVFVRAVDRELCFYAAQTLKEHGLHILGYGSGSVRVVVPDGMPTTDWVTALLEAGAMPPLMAPGSLRKEWVYRALDMDADDVQPTARQLMYAAFLMGDLDMVVELADVLL